jgi:hypothetical protein
MFSGGLWHEMEGYGGGTGNRTQATVLPVDGLAIRSITALAPLR